MQMQVIQRVDVHTVSSDAGNPASRCAHALSVLTQVTQQVDVHTVSRQVTQRVDVHTFSIDAENRDSE